MDVFQYSPIDLDRPALRLVRLRAARAGPEIVCEFIEAFFDEDYVPDYEAISYTWGGVDTPAEIQLNGSKFAVTENLLSVLQDVRYEDEDRILWIDAVCINQGSHSELGHQVKQMDQIYRRAHRVVIWLGPLTEPIRRLMDSLADLHRQIPGINWPPTDPRWQISRNRLEDSSAEALHTLAQTFMDILERPWFRRVWVIQEVANARAALVHCGPKSVTARVFAACPNLLDVRLDLNIRGSERASNPYAHCQAVLDVMPGPSRRESWWNRDRDLLTLLKKFSNTKATREHDKVFALLGMCPDANAEIPVDYTLPIDELNRKVLLHIYPSNLKHLEFIGYATVESLVEDLDKLHYIILGSLLRNSEPSIVDAFISEYKQQLMLTEYLLLAAMYNPYGKRYCFAAVLGLYRGYDVETSHVARVLPKVVAHGSAAMVKALLQCIPKCDLEVRSEMGDTAMTEASTRGDSAVVKLLLDGGADCNRKNDVFCSPLQCAVENGKEDVILLLLARGASWPQERSTQGTMLTQAIKRGQWGIVQILIDTGADLEDVSFDGNTALVTASRSGYEDIVKLLLERGADCNHRDRAGNTPVMAASMRGHEAIVRLLCDKGADCTLRNTADETPMFRAAELGHTAVVELLLELGVDFETEHHFRATPLSVAQTMQHNDVVQLLQRKRRKRGGAETREKA